MKRYISIVCTALVCFFSLSFPVSANEISNDYYWFEALDYSSVDNGSNTTTNFEDISIPLHQREVVYNIDILFLANGTDIQLGVYKGWPETLYNLTVERVYGLLYRAYGNVGGSGMSTMKISISGTNITAVTFYSCKYTTVNSLSFDADAYCNIVTSESNLTFHYVSTGETSEPIYFYNSQPIVSYYSLSFWSDEWKKYDYMDYYLYTCVGSISSISCTIGGQSVPITVSYIDNDSSLSSSYFTYLIQVDLTALDRTSEDYPLIVVEGNLEIESSNFVSILGVTGYVLVDTVNPLFYYFRDLKNNLSTLFSNLISSISSHFTNLNSWIDAQTTAIVSAIRGDTTPGNEFQQEVEEKDQQLDDMAAVMDSVERPELDSVNVSVDTYIDSTVVNDSMNVLAGYMSGDVYGSILFMSIIMATCSFVLFGKR